MEIGRHAEYNHIVFLLRPVDVGTFVRHLPADGLHLLCPAGIDFNLARLGIEHRVAAEEFLAHFLFHPHALLIELVAHLAAGGHGDEILTVHDLRHMVRRNAAPVADARRAVLVPAGIAAVGVALRVADEDRHIRVIHILIHDDVIALLRVAKVDEVIVVLGIVARDLAGGIEFPEQLRPEDGFHLRHRGARVQAV